MQDEFRSPAPYVANVIAPRPGACFRMVPDSTRGGYPMRCTEPAAFAGMFVDPKGRRVPVHSCAGHAPDLVESRCLD